MNITDYLDYDIKLLLEDYVKELIKNKLDKG